MPQNVRKRIHLIYGIVFSAVTLIAGICFITACYGIYTAGLQAGGQIYSRDIVSEAFSRICIPVYLCLALTVGGFVLHLALPLEKKKLVAEKNRPLILSRLQEKTDLAACDADLRLAIEKQGKNRRLVIWAGAAVCAVCAVIFLVYACNGENWAPVQFVTDSMIESMKVFLPCLAISLAAAIFAMYFCRNSLDREIELMKQASAQAPRKAENKPAAKKNRWVMTVVRCAVVALGIGLILYGVDEKGVMAVVAKAVAICTECIGLG